MRHACCIEVAQEKMFVSFASVSGMRVVFLREIQLPLSQGEADFTSFLHHHGETLEHAIQVVEKELSVEVEKIFCVAPFSIVNRHVFEEVIPFGLRKKIVPRDIFSARKHLEDVSLGWDDHCVHHCPLRYEAEGKTHAIPPLGVETRKIKLQSLLVWIKERVWSDANEIFDNLERQFGGFLAPGISVLASAFPRVRRGESRVVVYIGDRLSFVVSLCDRFYTVSDSAPFGLEQLLQVIGERFSLSPDLAQEVFTRYISFKELSRTNPGGVQKEIKIKDGDTYINVGVYSLNVFLKEYIQTQIGALLDESGLSFSGEKTIFSVIGRLNQKEGFYSFVKSFFPYSLEPAATAKSCSSTLGGLRYSATRFLESDVSLQKSWAARALQVYKEYF